jgi:hypothetical protein
MKNIILGGPELYEIDFEKVKTIDDLKAVLMKLGIKFNGDDGIKGIEHLVKKI